MNRPTRMHYRLKPETRVPTRITCICGKDVHLNHYFANTTDNMDCVSCPCCIEALKRDNWYCSEHGFIADANVTSNETCDQCKRSVV